MQMSGTLGLSNVEQSLMQVEKFKYQKDMTLKQTYP